MAQAREQRMSATLEQLGIEELDIAERLDLISLIWDSITDSELSPPLPAWHQRELERRRATAAADPGAGMPWTEVRERLRESP